MHLLTPLSLAALTLMTSPLALAGSARQMATCSQKMADTSVDLDIGTVIDGQLAGKTVALLYATGMNNKRELKAIYDVTYNKPGSNQEESYEGDGFQLLIPRSTVGNGKPNPTTLSVENNQELGLPDLNRENKTLCFFNN